MPVARPAPTRLANAYSQHIQRYWGAGLLQAGHSGANTVTESDNKTVTKESLHFVFKNSLTGKPFTKAKDTAEFWNHHLRKAGLRQRGISQCRHTFASRLLTLVNTRRSGLQII